MSSLGYASETEANTSQWGRTMWPFRGMQPVEGWVHKSLGLAAVSYSVMAAYGVFFLDWNLFSRIVEGVTAVVLCLAFFGSRSAPLLSVSAGLTVIILEICLSLYNAGTLVSPSYGVLPVVVIASGLLLGGVAALTAGAAALLLAPLSVYLSGNWGWDFRYFDHKLDGLWLLIGELSIIVCALLTRYTVNAFSATWRASERARRRYRDLFDNAPDGLVAIGPGGIIQEVNVVARRILGLELPQLKDRLFNEAWGESGGQGCMALESLRAGTVIQAELRDVSGGRRRIEFSVRKEPTADSEILLVMRDISDRDGLAEKLGHGQRLEMVGRLAGGVAHDFNNLLTVVAGNAAILSGHSDPEVRALSAEIFESQRRGSNLVRQLLAFARRDVRRPELIDLGLMVRGFTRLLERMLGEQYRLEIQSEDHAMVTADLAQMEQVVLNLVGNARDAMAGGGVVRLHIRVLGLSAAQQMGSSLSALRQVLLEVEDTGQGMSPEVKARIFEPFFTTKPRGEGTGLGLSSVHGIVEQSGGSVMADSAPGQGTRMRVFLPLGAEAPRNSVATVVEEPKQRRAGVLRILFVEDESYVRALGVRVLRRAGHEVVEAANAEEALARIGSEPGFDLLCTDVVMPGLSGPELVTKLREAGTHAKLPVLFMSGYFKNTLQDEEGFLGQEFLLQKPFTPDELLAAVDELLGSRPKDAQGGRS